MAKHKLLALDVAEFETVYRILITSPSEGGLSQLRTLTDLLEAMEDLGHAKGPDTGEGVPLFTVHDEVELRLTKNEETTFKAMLTAGVGKYQAWAVRPVIGVLDRLAEAEAVDPKE